ncbi:hypothetical protein [Aurantiacibacter luteus]|uniref:Uncharacterized protein n=1 Tax=Aurantiacibacter luteus TaxID=1581420 RepID=A0A0G9MXQ7_9SPHN|nr:hypothetical protein [Aurantiacibacter luteus]KLE35572.1 hypothetical protein AAW00_03910 [Aurantiacibacter luteus]
MRKIILSTALASTALALTACGDAPETTMDDRVAENSIDVPEAPEASGVMDASTVTAEQLAAAGVSQEAAAAIVAGQPYANVTAFNEVLMQSMTEEQAAALRANVFVPVNLNTATRDELALIPGIDDRMIHEFEEYVPYDDMAEFDREIGKYVDADEVARYRQYVTL